MRMLFRALLGFAVLLVLSVVGLGVALVQSAIRPARTVGVQVASATDGHTRPVSTVIFYPAQGEAKLTWLGLTPVMLARDAQVAEGEHPLILISHGTAGSPTSHLDTALALAEQGFIVAALVHNGDNYRDQSSVGAPHWISDRAFEIVRTTDYMVGAWEQRASVDRDRIGLFGFSAGATTALANIGGVPDFGRVAEACQTNPEFVCELLAPGAVLSDPPAEVHDNRIRAALLAAPGFGMAFTPASVQTVTIPVEVWVGASDVNTPSATNAAAIAQLLPSRPRVHVIEGAGHASFLAPCGLTAAIMPPMVCADPGEFDRAAFHRTFNAEVVAFFSRSMNYSG
jgi:predicted dienelactone hydrolase